MRIIFAGTPSFAASHLEALIHSEHEVAAVVTQPDRPGKRGKALVPTPVKRVATEHGISVLQPSKIAGSALVDYEADVLVVVAYGQILRKDALNATRLGAINVHASLLPRWRGAAPIQRAIQAGDSTTGVCIMQMDEGLDTGPVYHRASVAIEANDTGDSLTAKLASIGMPALLTVLDQLDNPNYMAEAQPNHGSTYAKKIKKSEAIIDWQIPVEALERTVRAFFSETIPVVKMNGSRFKVLEARAQTEEKMSGQNALGTISEITKAGVKILGTDGHLLITALQIPNAKGSVMRGGELKNLSTFGIKVGACFDSLSDS